MQGLIGLDIFRQALSYSYETAQLEEDPGKALNETLDDDLFSSLQNQSKSYQGMYPGREYYVNAVMTKRQGIYPNLLAYGGCWFSWVCNRSGGTLAQGALTKWRQETITNIDSGAIGSITQAALAAVAGQLVGDLLICTDNADSAGAAPEGEGRFIIKNTATVVSVQPDFSVAPAVNDDFVIRTNNKVVAAAIGDSNAEVAGVVINPDGIADDFWGWVLTHGRVGLLGKAVTAIAADKMIIADTGRASISSTSESGLGIGYSLSDLAADSVSDIFWAYINVRNALGETV